MLALEEDLEMWFNALIQLAGALQPRKLGRACSSEKTVGAMKLLPWPLGHHCKKGVSGSGGKGGKCHKNHGDQGLSPVVSFFFFLVCDLYFQPANF